MTVLNEHAKDTLREYGVSQAAWLRLHPNPDKCGCPDSRCIGHHHGESDVDGCDLRYWIEDDLAEGRVTSRWAVLG